MTSREQIIAAAYLDEMEKIAISVDTAEAARQKASDQYWRLHNEWNRVAKEQRDLRRQMAESGMDPEKEAKWEELKRRLTDLEAAAGRRQRQAILLGGEDIVDLGMVRTSPTDPQKFDNWLRREAMAGRSYGHAADRDEIIRRETEKWDFDGRAKRLIKGVRYPDTPGREPVTPASHPEKYENLSKFPSLVDPARRSGRVGHQSTVQMSTPLLAAIRSGDSEYGDYFSQVGHRSVGSADHTKAVEGSLEAPRVAPAPARPASVEPPAPAKPAAVVPDAAESLPVRPAVADAPMTWKGKAGLVGGGLLAGGGGMWLLNRHKNRSHR